MFKEGVVDKIGFIMLVLLSCAKTMSETSKVKVPLTTVPRFQKEAFGIALQMSQFSMDELERLLRINARMAVELTEKRCLSRYS